MLQAPHIKHRRKFRPGPQVCSPWAFMDYLEAGRHFYHRHKFTHNAWARGWQAGWILHELQRGTIHLAELVGVES